MSATTEIVKRSDNVGSEEEVFASATYESLEKELHENDAELDAASDVFVCYSQDVLRLNLALEEGAEVGLAMAEMEELMVKRDVAMAHMEAAKARREAIITNAFVILVRMREILSIQRKCLAKQMRTAKIALRINISTFLILSLEWLFLPLRLRRSSWRLWKPTAWELIIQGNPDGCISLITVISCVMVCLVAIQYLILLRVNKLHAKQFAHEKSEPYQGISWKQHGRLIFGVATTLYSQWFVYRTHSRLYSP